MNPKLKLVEKKPVPVSPDATAGVGPAQVEMPFAMVHGEAITQLPRG